MKSTSHNFFKNNSVTSRRVKLVAIVTALGILLLFLSSGNNIDVKQKKEKNEKYLHSSFSTPSPPKDELHFIPNVKRNIDIEAFVKESKDRVNGRREKILRNLHALWLRSFDEDERVTKRRVVPGLVIPTFKDGDHLENLLLAFDTPFRHITFINNAPDKNGDPVIRQIMDTLQPMQDAGAVSVYWHPENAGFSSSINIGLRRTRRVLTETAAAHPASWDFVKNPLWYFIVNCDSIFQPTAAQTFAIATNDELAKPDSLRMVEWLSDWIEPKKAGLFYATAVDHFCFAISDEAVLKAGDMDEVFYPAYVEDIDWRWRVHLAGFGDFLTGASVGHHRSVNLKKASPDSPFMQMLDRSARGGVYGRVKWANIISGKGRSYFSSSGRMTPFGIKNFPVNLYVVDPAHRDCVRTGNGPKHLGTNACWYNGSVLLPYLPPGTELPPCLKRPEEPLSRCFDEESSERFNLEQLRVWSLW